MSSETLFAKNVLSLKQRSLLAPGPRKQGCLHVTLAVASKTRTFIKDFYHAASETKHQIFGYSHSHQTKIPPPPPPATSGIAISGLRFLALHLWWCNDLLNEATATTTRKQGKVPEMMAELVYLHMVIIKMKKYSSVNFGVFQKFLFKRNKIFNKEVCKKHFVILGHLFLSSPFLVSLFCSRSRMQGNVSRLILICLPSPYKAKNGKLKIRDLRYPIPREEKTHLQ